MKSFKPELLSYCFIASGSLIMALAVVGFLAPYNVATVGTAGLAIVLHHVFNFPTGLLMAIINVPLLLVSLKYLGKNFAIKTIVCIAFIVVFVDVLAEVVSLPNLSYNIILATLY